MSVTTNNKIELIKDLKKMTSRYFSELNKLKNSQKQLERYQVTIFDQLTRIQNPDFLQSIQCYQNFRLVCGDSGDKTAVREILDSLKYMRRVVILESGKNVPDLELFQDDLINLLHRIQNLSIQSKIDFEELAIVENQVNEDMKEFTERLCIWTEPLKVDFHKTEIPSKVDMAYNDLPKDVKLFMNFIKTSKGHENGWSQHDHHLFLKLRKKYKDLNELFSSIHEILPDISLEDVKKHEAWYIKYLNLKEKHNAAIRQWQKERNNVVSTNSDSVEVIQLSEKKHGELNRPMQKNYEEKNKVKEDIKKWKKDQEKLKNIEHELKVQEAEKIKQRDEEKKQEIQIKKEFIKKWKSEKIALEQQKRKNEEIQNMMEQQIRASVANKMIKHFQMRDKEFFNKHLRREERKGSEEIPKRYSQMKRNPERLFKPTEQWTRRFISIGEIDPIKRVNFIAGVSKLQANTPMET